MLKRLLMTGLALVLTLMTVTIVVLLGTVTHVDAVRYSDWIDATQVTNPLPGQLYEVTDDGEIETQLCLLTKNDFNISTDALSGRIFVNHLGEAVPAVIWIARTWLQVDEGAEHAFHLDYRLEWGGLERESAPSTELTAGNKRILQPRNMERIRQQASAPQQADLQRLENCANEILRTFEDGQNVCQLTEVIREDTGRTLAVRFDTRCLARPESGPRRLPALRAGSFWTSVKLGLGLVGQQLAPPVLADAAG